MPNNLLLVANYSNDVGYAWNNIFKLFEVIIDRFDGTETKVLVSFAKVVEPVDQVPADLKTTVLTWDPYNRSPGSILRILLLIKKNEIRYLYFTDFPFYDWIYPIFRLAGVRRIIVHSRVSVASPYAAAHEKGFKIIIKRILCSINYLCADRVYAVSDFVSNRFINKNGVHPDKVKTILNGIDVNRFQPVKLGATQKLIIFVSGRATLHKGIQVLIEAVKLLSPRMRELIEIRYAGDGPDMSVLVSMVEKGGLSSVFTFLGQIPNTVEELMAANIVVVPSVWGDACPSSVSEALASGKPLIATRAGGIPEIIGEGDNAILVDPGDVDSLSQALVSLITDHTRRESLGINARKRAEHALDRNAYHQKVLTELSHDLGL